MIATLLFVLMQQAPVEHRPPERPRDPHERSLERPRDPWVFRSVLDQKPRIVTIALAPEIWVAYDATTCGLYKAWRGGVHFDGAVYTTVHGPQPTSRGNAYALGFDRPVWEAFDAKGPIDARAVWRGYRLADGGVVLLYDLELAGGRTVRIEETPEVVRPEERFTPDQLEEGGITPGDVGFLRVFRALDAPDDVKLSVLLRTDGARAKISGPLEREQFVDVTAPDGTSTTEIHSHLVLGRALAQNHVLLFFEPLPEPVDEPAPSADEPAPDAPSSTGGEEPPR